ncbi:hypothetical protein [Synechococcus phage S-H34]|uniref:Chromophore lyase CpcS/CpeS n=1 Tax=Synechococcus phage S-H34 TaxID=2718942 RepID=A0A6G8R6C0_9CAUD|nr:hypothetical protein PQC15_gp070 [Synechococcus phage S-H34]QIN96942.1 hypothetical protein [Synechococcus phage S-H34]
MSFTMTTLYTDWFSRCEGDWTSERRYLMGPKRTVDNLTTNFRIERRAADEWAVCWESDRNEGEMGIILDETEGVVKRSRNYFEGAEGTVTKLERIDQDTVVFYSSYGGMDYREEIRFLGNNFRLRQTVGYKEGTDKIVVVGQYAEYRV